VTVTRALPLAAARAEAGRLLPVVGFLTTVVLRPGLIADLKEGHYFV
jgi:hypothetical protein